MNKGLFDMLATKNNFILHLRIRALVICSFLSFFTANLQSNVVVRQKQNLITLVKKHPVASIVVGGCIAWLVYKMAKNYRERGQLMPPPQWLLSFQNRNRSRRDDFPVVEAPHVSVQRRRQGVESSSPIRSSVSSREDRDRARDWDEFEAEQMLNYGWLYSGDFPRWREAKYGRGGPFRPIFNLNFRVNQAPVQVRNNRSELPSVVAQLANDNGKEHEHFEEVLKHGTAEEQDALGNNYLHGIAGLKQDTAKAFRLFTIAASKGLPIARHNLGHCYFNGLGVAQDVSKAFEIFDALNKQGVARKETQFYLGLCYLRGNGVRKNYLEALYYFRNAADGGDAEGQLLMCHILRKGIIVPKDEILADSYFELAKRTLGSESAARKKFDECKLHTLFLQPDVTKNCVGEQCCICAGGRSPFQPGDIISILPCGHSFCQDCLARWFEEKTTCPLCRRVVQPQEVKVGTVEQIIHGP